MPGGTGRRNRGQKLLLFHVLSWPLSRSPAWMGASDEERKSQTTSILRRVYPTRRRSCGRRARRVSLPLRLAGSPGDRHPRGGLSRHALCLPTRAAHPVDASRLCRGVSRKTAEASSAAYVPSTAVAAVRSGAHRVRRCTVCLRHLT
jgi:hypothetical protein